MTTGSPHPAAAHGPQRPPAVPTGRRTDGPRRARAGAPDQLFDQLAGGTLLGRVAGPEDVAQVYVGLMRQDYVTGDVTGVDGGSLLK